MGEKTMINRTKLCVSIQMGKPCLFLDKCRFAHSIDELQINMCLFSDNCIYVTRQSEEYWLNKTKGKICKYLHQNETKENYVKRIKYGKDQKIMPPPKKHTEEIPDINHIYSTISYTEPHLIRGPKHIVEQIISLAILQGKKNLVIQITD
jgi:hypothetical protein